MKQLIYEIKAVTLNKRSIIVGISCLIISVITTIFVYNNSIYSGEIVSGKYQEIFGDKAIAQVSEFPDTYYGTLYGQKLVDAANSYNQHVNPVTKRSEAHFENLINSDTSSIIFPFLYVNINRENPLLTWKDDAYIPLEIASDFYKLRTEEVFYQADKQRDDKIKNKVIEMEKNLKIPFYLDKTARFWRTVIEFLNVLLVVSMFASIILAAPMFAQTFEDGIRDIIMTSRLGRVKFSINRIVATQILVTLIYIVSIVPYLTFMVTKIGYEGLSTSFQYISLFSSVNATIGGVLISYLIVGWIGIQAMACLTLLLSSVLQRTYTTGIISILLVICTFSYSFFFRGGSKDSLILKIINLSPMNSSQYIYTYSTNQFVSIIGKVLYLPKAILYSYIVCIIIFLGLAMISYRRKEQ